MRGFSLVPGAGAFLPFIELATEDHGLKKDGRTVAKMPVIEPEEDCGDDGIADLVAGDAATDVRFARVAAGHWHFAVELIKLPHWHLLHDMLIFPAAEDHKCWRIPNPLIPPGSAFVII
jgi:hypothetical protein